MEMQGRDNKAYFNDAGDGAWSNFSREMDSIKRSQKRNCRIIGLLLFLLSVVILALVAVAGTQARTIRRLNDRKGLITHPNVTFASYAGDRELDGLTYGGSMFRGSGFWTPRENLPASLTDHSSVGIGELVYIIGGANASGAVLDQFLVYDTTLHNYTTLSPIPEPRYRFGAAVLDNKIYVIGGRKDSNETDPPASNASLSVATYIYDTTQGTWSKGADILEPQSDPCAAALNGKVYLVGGYDANYGLLAKVQVYDPASDSWSYAPDMPTPRGDLMCAAFEGEIYVLGGYTGDTTDPFSRKMESFNPNTQKWTTRPDLLTSRGDGAVAVLPTRKALLVIGGEGHYRNNDLFKYGKHSNEVYFATDGTWVEKALIPNARFRTAAAESGGLVYVSGGVDTCINQGTQACPALDTTAVFLDVDHPHVYIYLKDEAYNDNAALTTYPL
ncbi:hypothetical protein R1sor_011827 [Riccia sorocarpa]|uniref:Attractin/MKLN-like beta-propeller domain-containing protein n=1 Tax=Riccia sorocarpa TaxID=122646 RepID=A0ABD3I6A3_9MARC